MKIQWGSSNELVFFFNLGLLSSSVGEIILSLVVHRVQPTTFDFGSFEDA
jgi:hypothetical protein